MSFILKSYQEWGLYDYLSVHLVKYFHKPLTYDILSDIIILTHCSRRWPVGNAKQMNEKAIALREQHALNPRPQAVTDETFTSGEGFFDPQDLVQVKYEMLRRVHKEGQSVTQATAAYGFSRPVFYQAKKALQKNGLPGLMPDYPGPRRAHKLTEEVADFLEQTLTVEPTLGGTRLARLVKERFDLSLNPRTFERWLARHKKKPDGKNP